MKRAAFLTLFFLMTLAPASYALRPGGKTVIFPIVGRFEGAMQTQWRTDVFVHNNTWLEINGTMTLYVAGGGAMEAPLTLAPYQTATYRDVVKSVFGLDTGSGQLHLSTGSDAFVDARGRIYNSGHPAGEFGQGIEAMAMDSLQTQSMLYGLDGTHGSRVNIGVANPHGVDVTVQLRVFDRDRNPLYWEDFPLGPYQTRQFNDIFTLFGIAPQENVVVEFYDGPETPIYGFSSEVRNDTGDAIFVFGTGPNAPTWP
jgi:hypothetical protein